MSKKRISTLILASTLIMSFSIPTFASPVESINIQPSIETSTFETSNYSVTMQDIGTHAIVQVNYADYYEIAARDKSTNIITVQSFDNNGNMISSNNYDFSAVSEEVEPLRAAGNYQHTLSNYEYDISSDSTGRHDSWSCRRLDDYKTRTYYTGNTIADRLDHWGDLVDAINGYEKDLAFAVGTTTALMAIEAFFTAGTASALTFLVGSASAHSAMTSLVETWGKADKVFDKL